MQSWEETFGRLRSLLHGPQSHADDPVPNHRWRMEMLSVLFDIYKHHKAPWQEEGMHYASQFEEHWKVWLATPRTEQQRKLWQEHVPFGTFPTIDFHGLEEQYQGTMSFDHDEDEATNWRIHESYFDARWQEGEFDDFCDLDDQGYEYFTDHDEIWFVGEVYTQQGKRKTVRKAYTNDDPQGFRWSELADILADWEMHLRNQDHPPELRYIYFEGITFHEDGSWETEWGS